MALEFYTLQKKLPDKAYSGTSMHMKSCNF